MKQLDLFIKSATLHSVCPEKNRYRYYRINLDDKTVSIEWGRLRKHPSIRYKFLNPKNVNRKIEIYENFRTAFKVYNRILINRFKRGYEIIYS